MSDEKYRPSIEPIGKKKESDVGVIEEKPLIVTKKPEEKLGSKEGFDLKSPGLKEVLRAAHARVDSPAMQSFKLPGTNRLVHDKRTEKQDASEALKDDYKAELAVKGDKVLEARKKDYVNYLGDRSQQFAQKEVLQKPQRPLSEFEDVLVHRFEKGQSLEQMLENAKARFLEKTMEQWRAFFARFAGRTVRKTTTISDVDGMLYRGMVRKGETKAVVISDLIHNSGRTEKFIRFGILYDRIGRLLSRLLPGDRITRQTVADGIGSDRLNYLALSPPMPDLSTLTGPRPSQGVFAAEATEARVAEDLGIDRQTRGAPTAAQRTATVLKKQKKFKLFKWFVGEDEFIDQSPQFIPWWHWGNLTKQGGRKIKAALYTGLFVVFILTMLFLVHQYLLGK